MEFGSQASQPVGDLAQAKLEEAQDKRKQAELAQALGDNERAAQLNAQADQLQQAWGDTGTLRLAAHTAIGALTGGTDGARGAAVGTLSAVADALNSAGLDGLLADSLIALASTAAGAGQISASIVGGSIRRAGMYSKEFIEWARNIYGTGTEKIIQSVYDETQAATDNGNE